jgi:multicomponent Na+:H+ antiporter subunit B
MSDRARSIVFFGAIIPLGLLLAGAVLRLPPSGHAASRVGDLIVGATQDERHTPDAVTAINFDYRGLDTLGEELILFAAVMGVVLLLRRSEHAGGDDEGDTPDDSAERHAPPTSDAVRVLGLALFGLTLLYGLYIIAHGQMTPGGGFQRWHPRRQRLALALHRWHGAHL